MHSSGSILISNRLRAQSCSDSQASHRSAGSPDRIQVPGGLAQSLVELQPCTKPMHAEDGELPGAQLPHPPKHRQMPGAAGLMCPTTGCQNPS
jgi:hypothetical protein